MTWRNAALIIAPLFLNLVFWITAGPSFWTFSGRPSSLLVGSAAGLLAAVLFFLGPAVVTSTKDSLWAAVTDSFGIVLSVALRFCATIFLALWMAQTASLYSWWVTGNFPPTPLETALVTGAILILVLLTSQNVETGAKLGSFSIKLAVAMATAALIRVHEGWPAILDGFPNARNQPVLPDLIRDSQSLSSYVAPFAFLAAGLCSKMASTRQTRITGLMGIALPVAASLDVMGAIGVATWASPLVRPGSPQTIGIALISGATKQGEKAILLIAVVVGLGAMRFAMAALEDCAGAAAFPKQFRWIALGALFSAIVWIVTHDALPSFQFSIIAMTTAGAVLTAQAIVGRAPRWAAALALVVGTTLPHAAHLWWPGDPWWWSPWLLPCYALSLLLALVGRIFTRPRHDQAPISSDF